EMDDVALLAPAQFDADRVDKDQPVELRRAADSDFGGDPATERKADHRDLAGQRVEHLAIEMHEVVHRVEILRKRRIAKAGMRRRDNFAMLGEQIEKRRLDADRVDAVDEQDGPPASPAQYLEIERPNREPVRGLHQPNS